MYDDYNDAYRTDNEIVINLNGLPYRLDMDSAAKLHDKLGKLLVETITYDGRN